MESRKYLQLNNGEAERLVSESEKSKEPIKNSSSINS